MGVSIKSVAGGMGRALWESGNCWWSHNHARSAAALAFYSLFSMVPIVMIASQLAAAMIGGEQAMEEIRHTTAMFFDHGAGVYLEGLLKEQPDPTFTGISSVASFLVLLFTASKVVVELRLVLTEIFGKRVRSGRRGQVLNLLFGRLVPVLLVIALGGVLALSALADALLQPATTYLSAYVPDKLKFWEWLQKLVSVASVVMLFALIVRWLPPSPPPFKEAAVGAVVAAVLLYILKSLVGIYFEQSSVVTAYGAAVTLVVVLLWIYFTIQIFFLGAEVTAYLGRLRRGEIQDPPRSKL
jgi:membrane protein